MRLLLYLAAVLIAMTTAAVSGQPPHRESPYDLRNFKLSETPCYDDSKEVNRQCHCKMGKVTSEDVNGEVRDEEQEIVRKEAVKIYEQQATSDCVCAPSEQGSSRLLGLCEQMIEANQSAQLQRCPLDPCHILPDKSKCTDFKTLKLQEFPEEAPRSVMPRHMQFCVDRYLTDKVQTSGIGRNDQFETTPEEERQFYAVFAAIAVALLFFGLAKRLRPLVLLVFLALPCTAIDLSDLLSRATTPSPALLELAEIVLGASIPTTPNPLLAEVVENRRRIAELEALLAAHKQDEEGKEEEDAEEVEDGDSRSGRDDDDNSSSDTSSRSGSGSSGSSEPRRKKIKKVATIGPLGALILIPMVLVYHICEVYARKRQVRRIGKTWGDKSNLNSVRIKRLLKAES